MARRISFRDLGDALSQGCGDFRAMPTHVPFLCVLYPVSGLLLWRALRGVALWPLLVSLAVVAAVTGPLAAAALYEISRRREQKLDTSVRHAADILRSPSLAPLLGLGALAAASVLALLGVEQRLYVLAFAEADPSSPAGFVDRIATTPEGHWLARAAVSVGALFVGALVTATTIAFPLLLDRRLSIPVALAAAGRVAARNPEVMMAWTVVAAGGLVVGLATALVGFAVVIPILGHASWHLYRRALTPPWGPRPSWEPPWRAKRLLLTAKPARGEAAAAPPEEVAGGDAIRRPPASPPGS